jgi:hypothetical protein
MGVQIQVEVSLRQEKNLKGGAMMNGFSSIISQIQRFRQGVALGPL